MSWLNLRDDHKGERNHWSARFPAASVGDMEALGHTSRSVLLLGGSRSMSILAHGLVENLVSDCRDQAAVIARLFPTASDLIRVRDYWRSVDPESKETYSSWTHIHHCVGTHFQVSVLAILECS